MRRGSTVLSIELRVLGLSALVWMGLLLIAAIGASRQVGSAYLMGPRDDQRPLEGRVARLKRALDNHTEGLVLFAVAVLVVELGHGGSAATTACAIAYLAARTLYIPAYAYGWTPARSLIWNVGFLATLLMLVLALVG